MEIQLDKRTGRNHHLWKGDEVGYHALHYWVRRHLPKVDLCEECGKVPPQDYANLSGKYKRDLLDWRQLCRSCHMKSDGRIRNLSGFLFGNKNTAKLKEADVKEVRLARKSGVPFKELALKYGVTVSCLEKIIYGRSWKNV